MAQEIEIYTTKEGIKLEIKFDGDTVWAHSGRWPNYLKPYPRILRFI